MDSYRTPSVFELIACDRLKGGLREALRYLLEQLTNNVGNFRKLPIPRSDETILLIDLLLEYNHLRAYNASYAESLYHLVRLDGKSKIKTKQLLPSLLCLTLLPYIRHKIDKYFEELNYKETRTADELRRIRLYRIFTKSCSFLNLICLVRFAAGKSSYHNLMDGLFDINLAGYNQIIDSNDETATILDRVSKTIADLMGRGLTFGSYIIQFLDYWNSHSNSAPLFNVALPIPEPPPKDDTDYVYAFVDGESVEEENNRGDSIVHYTKGDRSSNVCLICLHVRQNECALSNTGFVFCYSCIHRYVTTKQRCPISGTPTTLDNIVKLFTSTPF